MILCLLLDWVVLKCTSRSCIILKSMSWNLENRLAYLTSDYCKDDFKLITSSNQMINKEMCPRWSLFFHLPLENQFSLEFSTLDKTLDSPSGFSFVPFWSTRRSWPCIKSPLMLPFFPVQPFICYLELIKSYDDASSEIKS